MLPRATWKGHLKIADVSCAVAMFAATTTAERISFRHVNPRTGNACRQQLVDEVTGEALSRDEVTKGYEISAGVFVTVDDADLEGIKLPSTSVLDVDHFLDPYEIDPVYLDTFFYVAPDDKVSEEAFFVFRDAMVESGLAGVARTVLSGRERLVTLSPRGSGMLATTLRFPYETRGDADVLSEISTSVPDPALVKLASKFMRKNKRRFKPKRYVDGYETALVDMIRRKYASHGAIGRKIGHGPLGDMGLAEALAASVAAPSSRGSNG